MDARLTGCWLALLLCLPAVPARADIYTCRNPQGALSIQDKPCGSGSRVQKIYRDTEPRAPRRAKLAASKEPGESGGSGGVPVGLKNERNKGVICGLLAAEKKEAQDQIAGRAPPPVGEDATENLAKIERQRSRVACEE